MTTKEKIIKRLNDGFGFSIPLDARWKTHERKYRDEGGMSWYFSDTRVYPSQNVGSADTVTECLSYDRWVIDQDEREIYEYFEHNLKFYELHDFLIEKK